jgi:hypothetical protein
MLRRLGQLTIAATAALGAWVVAPALSTTPYLPAPVDFEQRLESVHAVAGSNGPSPPPRHAHEGPVTHRSAVIEAPARFDLVGIAGERRPVELRARDGGTWSEWVEVANGDPLYTGGSDAVQLRTRGWRPDGRLHYVNVSGDATDAGGALNAVRGAVNSAFVSAASVFADTAEASPSKPNFITRREWGANRDSGGCRPRTRPSYGRVKAGAVHHTVTTNNYSESEGRSIVLGICRYHRNANGWNDIGYNALVDRFGNLYVGRDGGIDKAVVGAQAQGYNSQTTGVAAIGDHSSAGLSRAAVRGFARFLAWKLWVHNRPAKGEVVLTSAGGDSNRYPAGRKVTVKRIFGHGRVNFTSCPGNGGRAKLDAIRDRAHRLQNR